MQSSPGAAQLTLLELIVGALLASGGHVTQAILALTPRLGWQAYHWMLERGRFRLLGLISALCRIVRREIGAGRCLSLSTTRWRRAVRSMRPVSRSASTTRPTPGVPAVPGLRHAVRRSAVPGPRSVPLVTGLCRSSGNAGKLAIAKGLLRAVGALRACCSTPGTCAAR